MTPTSIPGVAHVELLRGAQADGPPDLLVEVAHGADRTAHFHALRERLRGPLPDGLVDFFHVNTDVGAWQLGREVALGAVARDPRRSALVIRCLVPRTFVDTNRVVGEASGDLAHGGVTAAVAPYVCDPEDVALLVELHRAYVARVADAVDAICGAGGLALFPHTYAPRSVGIDRVDDEIVANLRRCWSDELAHTWPLRPEVDLLTRTPDGVDLAPPGAAATLADAYRALGLDAAVCGTYDLHPATQAAAHAERHPGRTLCLELRRDLLVERWTPFAEMEVDTGAVTRLAEPLADFVHACGRAP